jgi:hypothetical protein
VADDDGCKIVMSETESIFLENAKKLDRSLAPMSERLRKYNTSVTNMSQLTYNYHVHHLSWSHSLTQEKAEASEIFRVTVNLDYLEPSRANEIASMDVTVTSEIFQKGANSRFFNRGSETIALNEQLLQNLEEIVFASFKKGWAFLEPESYVNTAS